MRAFIAHSFDNKLEQERVIDCIISVLKSRSIIPFSFVREYPPYGEGTEGSMMVDAFCELSNSDLLIAEGSKKAVGVGIEVGYARAKGLTVIYVYQADSEVSKTLKGSADVSIKYVDTQDLKISLETVLLRIKEQSLNLTKSVAVIKAL